jgi:Glucodextranase, domain B
LATGEVSLVETEPLSWCTGNAWPPSSTCVPVSTGLSLRRTITTSSLGMVATVRDVFSSTDKHSHSLSIQYTNTLLTPQDGTAGFQRAGQSALAAVAANTTVTLPAAAGTIFATSDRFAADGSLARTDLAYVYSGRPALFFNSTSGFGLSYTRSVTATVPAQLGFAHIVGFTMSSVSSAASSSVSALRGVLSITSPANKAVIRKATTLVRGKITGDANGLPTKVTVTAGLQTKTVSVSSTGLWSATFSLKRGPHPVRATAKDPAGNTLTARAITITNKY